MFLKDSLLSLRNIAKQTDKEKESPPPRKKENKKERKVGVGRSEIGTQHKKD